jgi:hypothetical protein
MHQAEAQRHIGRSVIAVLVGILAGVIPTLAVDAVLHKTGFYPSLGEPTPSGPLVVATAYRIVFSIFGSYIVARLAPNRPMGHALISGAIGVIVSIAGAVATWNSNLGPHWYPIALIITAIPCAWAGGRITLAQLRHKGPTAETPSGDN